jgi:flagellum-specific peptidoglycan hydrolase FlgJ
MTRQEALAKIAEGSVAVEQEFGVPAELCAAQCILESGWLTKAPGNNPFGIKARTGEPSVAVTTTEYVSPSEIARLQRAGKQVLATDEVSGGKIKATIIDDFAAYESITDAFLAYGRLMSKGRYFAPRLERFQQHRSLDQLLADMSGKDGLPPYATAPNYAQSILQIANQTNVQTALKLARKADV